MSRDIGSGRSRSRSRARQSSSDGGRKMGGVGVGAVIRTVSGIVVVAGASISKI